MLSHSLALVAEGSCSERERFNFSGWSDVLEWTGDREIMLHGSTELTEMLDI